MGNEILVKESPPQPGRRERWLAALAHASILVYLLGSLSGQFWICCIFPLLLPFLQAFNTRKDKWVLFHVWQAAIYQVILLCITVLGSVIFGIPAYLVIVPPPVRGYFSHPP
jgi:fatty acid desaturase